MMALDFQTLAQASAGRVLNSMAEALALAALSWVALRLAGVRSAVTRFAVWFSTLLAVALMPLLVRTASPASQSPHLQLSGRWASDLFRAWLAIAGLLMVRLGVSLWHLWRLRRDCREIDQAAHFELIRSIASRANGRDVKLLVADKVRIPTAIGFFHPAVVLPAWTLNQLSVEELNAVVLHELAHLRRWDDWTNLAQKFLKAIFFFHPAVWFIESRLALEREIACDDFVVEHTASAKLYAASLVSLAERVLHEKTLHRTIALAQSALGKMRQTSLRIAHILQPGPSESKNSRSKNVWRPAVAGAAVLMATLVATPYGPQMVSFRSEPEFSAAVAGSVTPAMTDAPATHVRAIKASAEIGWPMAKGKILAGEGSIRLRTGQVRATHLRFRSGQSSAVPVHAELRPRKPKVVLTKTNIQQPPTPTLLVFHFANGQSTDLNALGSPVWSLCVWRVIVGENGVPQIEETIVVNRI